MLQNINSTVEKFESATEITASTEYRETQRKK